MLYVFGSNRFPGWGFEAALGMDGAWVGAVSHNGDYFTLPIKPGEHHLCARVADRNGPFLTPMFRFENTTHYFLRAQPGQTYFLDFRVGRRSAGFLQVLDSGKGRQFLTSAVFTTSHPR